MRGRSCLAAAALVATALVAGCGGRGAEEIVPAGADAPGSRATTLCRGWVHSVEEQTPGGREQVFRPKGSRAFPPSRFRMEYEFAKGGDCRSYVLSPDDAHHFRPGRWTLDPKDEALLAIETDGATARFRIDSLTADELRMTPVQGADGTSPR